jgi:hypothetical protein
MSQRTVPQCTNGHPRRKKMCMCEDNKIISIMDDHDDADGDSEGEDDDDEGEEGYLADDDDEDDDVEGNDAGLSF